MSRTIGTMPPEAVSAKPVALISNGAIAVGILLSGFVVREPAPYLMLTTWTISGGFRMLFRDRPWQAYLLCAYVTFIGHVGLGSVIDTDHWRHFYLLLGLIWGAMAPEAAPARRKQAAGISRWSIIPEIRRLFGMMRHATNGAG